MCTTDAYAPEPLPEDFSEAPWTARRVIAPSRDCAARLREHFPRHAANHAVGNGCGVSRGARRFRTCEAARARICVIGGIGAEKGYDVLLACARDAAKRGLPLEFVVVGYTLGRRFACSPPGGSSSPAPTPRQRRSGLIREQQAEHRLPALGPCRKAGAFRLSDAWRAGLDAIAWFDLGAQAERIPRAGVGGGSFSRQGCLSPALNNVLLAARSPTDKK